MKVYCKVESIVHNKTRYIQCYTIYERTYSSLWESKDTGTTYNTSFCLGIRTYMDNKIIFDSSERRFLSLFVIGI